MVRENTKIAVVGAGAVGCYYGGMLARAGHSVALVARPQHVEAIQGNGLLLDTLNFKQHISLEASSSAQIIKGAKLVLCCVKSTDTEQAAVDIAPFLEPDATLLSLQNGVNNAERLQKILARPVAPAVVYVATEMAGPGHVKHHGRGELLVGPQAMTEAQVKMFVDAGVPIQISENVVGTQWAKLIINCAYNALSAITQVPYGRLLEGPGISEVMDDVVQECLAVAKREGVNVPDTIAENIRNIARTMPGQFSSTAQDLARHKVSEIDYLNGYVVARGLALGVPTPVNRTLHALVKVLENKNIGQGV